MGRPKGTKNKVEEPIVASIVPGNDSTSTMVAERLEPVNETPVPVQNTRATFTYPVPETKEYLLALHKCLKDTGCNSIGDIEVRASRL